MAAQTWPSTLPDFVLQDGYEERPPDLMVRSEMDVGAAKHRRRATAAPEPIKCRVYLDNSQVDTLDSFFETTLERGALRFDWVHPRTQNNVEMRFRSRPRFTPDGPTNFIAELELEVMP